MVSNLTTQPVGINNEVTVNKRRNCYAPLIIGGAVVGGGAGAYITKKNLSTPTSKNNIITQLTEKYLNKYYQEALELIKNFKNKEEINPLKGKLTTIIENMKNFISEENLTDKIDDLVKNYKKNKYIKNIGLGIISGAVIASIPLLINNVKPAPQVTPQEPVNNLNV